MKSPIFHTDGYRVFATSKDVATFFGKNHKEVMRAVRAVAETDPSLRRNFALFESDIHIGFGFR